MKEKDIVIKSSRNGLSLTLNPSLETEELLTAAGEKFKDAAKFFGSAELFLEIDGRSLNDDEVDRLVSVIEDSTEITIKAVFDHSEINNRRFKAAYDDYMYALKEKACEIYTGEIKDSLEFKGNVLISGNVPAGCEVHSAGSIYVLGKLDGDVYAGELGDEKAVVYAGILGEGRVMIADCVYSENETVKEVKPKKLFGKKEEVKAKVPVLISITEGAVKAEELC